MPREGIAARSRHIKLESRAAELGEGLPSPRTPSRTPSLSR